MPSQRTIRFMGVTFDLHLMLIMLGTPLLLTLYYYHGTPAAYLSVFNVITEPSTDLPGRAWQFGIFFALMGLIPLAYFLFYMKGDLTEIGLGAGDWRHGLKWVGLLVPLVVVPLIWLATDMPEVKSEYPLAKSLFTQPHFFWLYEAMYILLYYVAWEFFFRGFLLFSMARRIGPAFAILIQTLASCLIHLGKPEGETIGAILVGVIFGALALQTRSIWYGWLIHITIGVLTDFFILYKAGVHIIGH